jgi:outer membrane autotransporter protein
MFRLSLVSSRVGSFIAAALFCLFGPALMGQQQVWAGNTYCFLWIELSPQNLPYGGSVDANVNVRPNSTANWSGNIGSGTVTFRLRDGATLGTTTLTRDGTRFKGSISFDTPSPGTYRIEALYSGDDELIDCSTMQSEVFEDIKVTKATPSPVINQSTTESGLGDAVTFTVDAPSIGSSFVAPSGKVTFYADGAELGSASVSGGKASISTSKLSKGDHSISARIASDANYKSATSNVITHSVTAPTYQIRALPETAPKGKLGDSYTLQFRGSGGVAPYTISKTGGALPKGLTFSASGLVSGTPKQTGDFPVTVQAVDANGVSDDVTVTISIAPYTITALPETAPAGKIGEAYTLQFSAKGGSAPYDLKLLQGNLPKGLTFSASGLVSGAPTEGGDFPITVRATDANGVFDDVTVTLSIGDYKITTLPETAPAGRVDEAYTLQFRAKGGKGPYAFTLAKGRLPKGLSFSSSGLVSGAPQKSGDFPITVRARDVNGVTDDVSVVISVSKSKIIVHPDTALAGKLGEAYTLQFYGTGGQAPYKFTLVGGALPSGLVLNASGKVSGSAGETGSFPIEVRGVDTNGLKDQTKVTIVIDRSSNTADVKGILEAERRAARRFGENQMDSVLGRMSSLHGADCLPSTLNINANGGALSKSNAGTICAEDYAVWFNGVYTIGARDQHGRQPKLDYGTAGFTAGLDRRLSESLIVGAAIGMGVDNTDIGEKGSRSEGQAFSVSAYGSYMFAEHAYLDAVVGYNKLDFSARRFVVDDIYARYDRDGDQLFAAASVSSIFDLGAIKATPYGRLKITATRLDETQEHGAFADNLTYQSSSDFTSSASVGVTLEKTFATDYGSIKPFLTLEYQGELSGGATQDAYYTAAPGDALSVRLDTLADNLATAQIGAEMSFGRTSVDLTYRGSSDFSDNWMQSVFGRLSVSF